ncbi:hypothetical protein [Sphingomonas desiccabilis]|uniref:hypothetical protein n=1 Tax=Sphingomonas desiccabilis TaxID=429134 RepID=UPI0017A7875E|nr:hypothetical protein [Sphingomonas desiccabilis]MBB3911130.1 hypothetical protein [Sphingomonas desiccabilis]
MGATTAHILGPWNELAAQLDALTPDTALATVTIGGNDVNYVGNLMNAAAGRAIQPPSEQAWERLAQSFDRIAAEVHRRAPGARLVFVDYLRLLAKGRPCAGTPVSPAQADMLRAAGRGGDRRSRAPGGRRPDPRLGAVARARRLGRRAVGEWLCGGGQGPGPVPPEPRRHACRRAGTRREPAALGAAAVQNSRVRR